MRWQRFVRRKAWDREHTREIDAHVALMADDLRERGVPSGEAERQARARFGNRALLREEIYEMNTLPWIETLARDARYAVRLLRRSPGFAATAILTLAIAIGANAAVFSLVDALLLQPLPYPKSQELSNVQVTQVTPRGTFESSSIDGATWEAIRDHVASADVAVYSNWRAGANLAVEGSALHVDQQRVGAGFFRVLGVPPAMGREFNADEDQEGGPDAVVLSHGLWIRAFGGDPSVLNRRVLLRGEPHTVIGVMPAHFVPLAAADLWTPIRASQRGQGGGINYAALLRLPGHVSRDQIEAELMSAYRSRGVTDNPDVDVSIGIVSLQDMQTESSREPLLTMWAAVALVLLIACVNLAGLLLARSRTRAQELATRVALGSGRVAVVRQLVVESLVLAVIGGALGIAVGYALLGGVQELAGTQYADWQRVTLDMRSVAATSAISLFAALLFGVYPAVSASRTNVQDVLRGADARGTSAPGGGWPRRLLIVSEVALGVVLLVGAGLLTRTFLTLRGLEPGFTLEHVVTATASLEDRRYESSAAVAQLFERSLERIDALPGVVSAAVSLGLPYERILNLGFRPLDGLAAADSERNFITNVTYVTPGYFETLGIPVKAGRAVSAADRAGTQPVVVVNEAFERLYYGDERVVGRSLGIAGEARQVVGVVGDVQVRQPGWGSGGPIRTTPIVYLAAAQTPSATLNLVHTWFAPTWVVRTSGPVEGMEQGLRAAIASVDPLLPTDEVRSMKAVRDSATASQRFMMVLALLLGGAATILSAIGLHGLIASTITERAREIGIRMALGSTRSQVVRSLAAPGIGLTVAGLALGVLLAWGTTAYIDSLLWGVEATDPATFAIAAAGLLLVSVAASVLPALRILRINPATTLRA